MTAIEEVDWLPLLRSKKKLDREKGLTQLKAILGSGPLEESERERLETCAFELISSLISPWEEKHGGLMAAALLVPLASEGFCEKIKGEVPLLMENHDYRVANGGCCIVIYNYYISHARAFPSCWTRHLYSCERTHNLVEV